MEKRLLPRNSSTDFLGSSPKLGTTGTHTSTIIRTNFSHFTDFYHTFEYEFLQTVEGFGPTRNIRLALDRVLSFHSASEDWHIYQI